MFFFLYFEKYLPYLSYRKSNVCQNNIFLEDNSKRPGRTRLSCAGTPRVSGVCAISDELC